MKKNFKLFLISILVIAIMISIPQLAHAEKKSGLLLGLKNDIPLPQNARVKGYTQGLKGSEYRTLLIYHSGNNFSVKEKDNIIIPTDNGFYIAGVTGKRRGNYYEEHPYAVPAGKKPKIVFFKDVMEVDHTTGFYFYKILYAGPKYIGVQEHSSGYTEHAAHPWLHNGISMRSLKQPEIRVSINSVLGNAAFAEFKNAAENYKKTHPQDKEKFAESVLPEDWTLVRRAGRWVVRGFIGYSIEVLRDFYAIFDIPVEPGKELSSYGRLDPAWDVIKQNIPNATDAYSSPEGDFLAVLTRNNIILFEKNKNGNIIFNRPARKINLKKSETPVMAEWATGNYTDKWAKAIDNI